MVLLAFVALLLVLSVVGVAMKIRSTDGTAASSCATAANAAFAFQSNVTRDLERHAGLHADTRAFVIELRSLGLPSCPGTQRFLVTAEETVASICADCAVELRGVQARS